MVIDSATLELMMAGNWESWVMLITVIIVAMLAYACGYLKGRMDEEIKYPKRYRPGLRYLDDGEIQ